MDLKIVLLDPTYLDEGFEMGALWLMRENLVRIKMALEGTLSSTLGLDPISHKEKLKKQLNHIVYNIDMVEMVMANKETLIFLETEVFTDAEYITDSVCKN
jgi:hypothetical protein